MVANGFRKSAPALVLLLLPLLLLGPSLVAGDDFLPSGLLSRFAPWSSSLPPRVGGVWNPLLYDAIGQFLPWRLFAARTLLSGHIPLWNPYQFCGTPFLANSQSAVLYPPNMLYLMVRPGLAAGLLALFHLWVAGLGLYGLSRRLGLGQSASLVAGAVWQLSGWQISWLLLPTFLDTSCWVGLLLLCIVDLHRRAALIPAVGAALASGLMLLAGHLQIAFYCLGTTSLLIVVSFLRQRGRSWRSALACTGALALGVAMALPQVLPVLELASWSHRAGRPTAAGYAAYTAYAVHPAALVTLVNPSVRGLPADPAQPYRGVSRGGQYFNYAEGAMFLGLPALLLAVLGSLGWRRDRRIRLLAALAIGSLLVACGTQVNAVLYFLVPGFGGSGSPGRVLVLFALSSALLAAYGVEYARTRPLLVTALGGLGVAVVGFGLEAVAARTWPEAFRGGAPEPAVRHYLLGGLLWVLLLLGRVRSQWSGWMAPGAVVISSAALLLHGVGLNPTAPGSWTYPEDPLLQQVRTVVGHNRIAVENRSWSFAGPDAVLPPNGGMVASVRDAQGYDSLFPGQYKRFLAQLLGRDPSPPEVGNMVFLKDATILAERIGAVAVLCRSAGSANASTEVKPVVGASGRAFTVPSAPVYWQEDRGERVSVRTGASVPLDLILRDQLMPGWSATVDGRPAGMARHDTVFRRVQVPPGRHQVEFVYRPASYQTGLYGLCLASLLVTIAICLSVAARPGRQS